MWSIKKQNKYRNVRQTYQGYSYASKKESQKAFELDLLQKAGEIKEWERQVKVELFGQNGMKICNYYVDFKVIHNDGMEEYLEVKSPITMTEVWRLKWKLLEDKLGKDFNVKLTVEV